MTQDLLADKKRGTRIRYVRTELLKMSSQEALAAALTDNGKPVTRGAVGNWEQGKPVGIDSLSAICELSGVNLDWLAYGRGAPRDLIRTFDPDAQDETHNTEATFGSHNWKPSSTGALPELDVKIGAGQGSIGEFLQVSIGADTVWAHRVVAEWTFPESYLREEVKASPNRTIVMEVIGDSMTPTYLPGDRVLVDLAQRQMISDTVYVISDGFSEPQIKRLQRVPFSNPPEIKIISDNKALETFQVKLSDLHIIGRVCGQIARR